MRSSSPILHVYSICHNEELLLPYFLRHYSTFSTKIIIYDNQSTDDSANIVASWPKAELRTLDSKNELRDDLLLNIKNQCWKESKGNADLVIVCDIDEFFYHPNIKGYLKEFMTEGDTVLRSMGFVMVGHIPPIGTGQIYDEIYKGVRDTGWSDKSILFKPNEIEEINYSPGCHECSPTGHVQIMEKRTDARLLHYRFLGENHTVQRYASRAVRLSAENRSQGWAFHYLWPEDKLRQIYQLHEKHALPVIGATSSWRRHNEANETTSWKLVEAVLSNGLLPTEDIKSTVSDHNLRLLMIGCCASGKSWLASKIAQTLGIPLHPMDEFFWYPGGFNKMHSNKKQKETAIEAIEKPDWLIEGAFGFMADWALLRTTTLIWLDLPWDEVLENCIVRFCKWDSCTREEVLKKHIPAFEWLKACFDPDCTSWCSRYFHNYLYNCFPGNKIKLSSRKEVTEFIQKCTNLIPGTKSK